MPNFKAQISDPKRVAGVQTRAKVERAIRIFFESRGFLEVRTPLLVRSPGMEPHIRPFEIKRSGPRVFLPTSPEFAMKKLLAGGMERIFQICPCFRDEPKSATHLAEFTMLEWYQAGQTYEALMSTAETLVESVALAISGRPEFVFGGDTINVATPWPRFTIEELFLDHAGVPLRQQGDRAGLHQACLKLGLGGSDQDTWDDLFFRIWLNLIEPKLPKDQAVFVYRYPEPQAALSRLESDPDGTRWARRFEMFAGGLELANAFEELCDPLEQRVRFKKDMALRASVYGDSFAESPVDEEFMSALSQGLPPCSGIALGVDRLVMLAAGQPDIEKTFWLSPFFGAEQERP